MTAPADMGAKGTGSDGPDDAVSQDYFDREPTADRFHNRAPHSPEALAEALGDVRDSLVALEGRLASVAGELESKMEGAEQRAAAAARRLALDVVDMGGALSRRVRALEHRPPIPGSELPPAAPAPLALPARPAPRRRERRLALSLILGAVLAAVLAGFWYWRQSAPAGAAAKPPIAKLTAAQAAPAPPPVASAPAQPAKPVWAQHPRLGHRPLPSSAESTSPSAARD